MRTQRRSMKWYMHPVAMFAVAALVSSCGGGGGGGSTTAAGPAAPPIPPAGPTFPGAGKRVEESDAAVKLTGTWTKSDASRGWSGGSALQSNVAGATASVTFIGTSVR